jgi:hypothetical protein
MRQHSPGPDHSEPLNRSKRDIQMTNPKNNTSNPGRRSFLLKAATVAAGSAALTVAASAGSSVLAYQNGSDPSDYRGASRANCCGAFGS